MPFRELTHAPFATFDRWSKYIEHVFWTVVSYSNLILRGALTLLLVPLSLTHISFLHLLLLLTFVCFGLGHIL